MGTHSSILAWRIPWMEKPGRLQFMGSQRVRHDWATSSVWPGAVLGWGRRMRPKLLLLVQLGWMSPVNWEEVSVIYWDDLWFSFFTLLMCCIVLINLHILNHPCIPGINPTWSWCVVHHQVISKSATPWTIAHQTCLSLAISQFAQIHVHFTGDTSNPLILCIVLLMCYWIQFASILLRILPSIFIFISDINLRFSFFVWDIFLVLVSWYW